MPICCLKFLPMTLFSVVALQEGQYLSWKISIFSFTAGLFTVEKVLLENIWLLI